MTDPAAPEPALDLSRAAGPAGGERRRLDRAPGDRYGSAAPAPDGDTREPRGTRWIVAAVVIADLGGLAFFVLGLLDLGLGLVAVAGLTGWATGVALVYRGRTSAIRAAQLRMATAAFLAGWAVVLGILLDWQFGLTQGGVMGFLPYVVERYGLVAPAALVAGGLVAAYRVR